MTNQTQLQKLRDSYASTLARSLGCTPSELPADISKADAASFLDLKNSKTLDVWKATKRYPLVYIKIGRHYRVGTDSILDLMISRAELPDVESA